MSTLLGLDVYKKEIFGNTKKYKDDFIKICEMLGWSVDEKFMALDIASGTYEVYITTKNELKFNFKINNAFHATCNWYDSDRIEIDEKIELNNNQIKVYWPLLWGRGLLKKYEKVIPLNEYWYLYFCCTDHSADNLEAIVQSAAKVLNRDNTIEQKEQLKSFILLMLNKLKNISYLKYITLLYSILSQPDYDPFSSDEDYDPSLVTDCDFLIGGDNALTIIQQTMQLEDDSIKFALLGLLITLVRKKIESIYEIAVEVACKYLLVPNLSSSTVSLCEALLKMGNGFEQFKKVVNKNKGHIEISIRENLQQVDRLLLKYKK
jgi:hypothetical protein